jgi:thioredoxin-related protein
MNKLLMIVFVAFATFAFTTKNTTAPSATINWMSFEEAIAAQKENPKKIMMDAYTNWCGPCKLLDKNTFHNADVVEYVNENYYAVKFNAEGNESITFRGKTYTNPRYNAAKANSRNSSHQLSSFFRIHAYPTILFLDEEANYLAPVKGYRTPKQLELYLKLFGNDDHKKVKTAEEWEAYQNNFIYTFE